MRVKRLTESAKLPTKANPGDLGYDLYADENMSIGSRLTTSVHTGIAIEFPEGYGGFIAERSSSAKEGLAIHGGVIDSGYRGEIVILMSSRLGMFPSYINKGQKIAQIILIPVINFDIEETKGPLQETVRGDKGFGSSGI